VKKLALPAAGLVLAGLLATAPFAVAQTTTPTPKPAPSVAQLCAATGITEVDALLDGVARSALVGALAPLLTLTVPGQDTAEIDVAVQLEQVRRALNCVDTTVTPTPTATATATPTATVTPAPTTTAPPVKRKPRPRGGVDTGA
jgi:hypothetical protein